MNKKGFALLETLIVVVILSASLLTIYKAYSYSVRNETIRLYYDDVAYIYETNYVKDIIKETNYVDVINHSDILYDITENLNSEQLSAFNVEKLYLFKADYDLMAVCSDGEIFSGNNELCNNSFASASENLIKYLRYLGNETYEEDEYLIVAVYKNDATYYASLSMGVHHE